MSVWPGAVSNRPDCVDSDVPASPVRRLFPDARAYAIGWGDGEAFPGTLTPGKAVRALAWPTSSVLHVHARSRAPGQGAGRGVGRGEGVTVALARAGLAHLAARIEADVGEVEVDEDVEAEEVEDEAAAEDDESEAAGEDDEEEADEAEDDEEPEVEDLTDISGVGDAKAETLREAGVAGDVGRATWSNVGLLSVVLVGSVAVFLRESWKYNALDAGSETARSVGVIGVSFCTNQQSHSLVDVTALVTRINIFAPGWGTTPNLSTVQ